MVARTVATPSTGGRRFDGTMSQHLAGCDYISVSIWDVIWIIGPVATARFRNRGVLLRQYHVALNANKIEGSGESPTR